MKFYLAQINTKLADIQFNADKILQELQKADEAGCNLAIFPEMALIGYDAKDLFRKKHFLDAANKKMQEIVDVSKKFKCAALIGCAFVATNRLKKEIIYNSVFLIQNGEIKKIIHKKTLANLGVFDEKRYFAPSDVLSYVEFGGQTLAILICEDMWDEKNLFMLSEQVFDTIIVVNSSPYEINKASRRLNIAKNIVAKLQKPLIYLNQIGGQDSLLFDGGSFVLDKNSEIFLQLKTFQEDKAVLEISKDGHLQSKYEKNIINFLDENIIYKSLYSACVLGLRDYVHKTGHEKVLLGMSGGIDSALVAAIAVDALGSQNVSLFALPSRFNSDESMQDAVQTAQNLDVKLEVISIEETFLAMLKTLDNQGISSLAKENMQARIRGNILMALANSNRGLLLSTGNKSEIAVGYATIYGDMCGAFNPIKDLYKTQIYKIVNWRNNNFPEISLYKKTNLIAKNILTKAPTAELRPNQKDSDSLPEYEILDAILYQIIEKEKSIAQIVNMGFDENIVKKIANLVKNSQHKRSQAALGVKVSEMSFDSDRRYPIAHNFQD